ncbi:MAG: hypothetical protein GWN79_04060 [Actinobacteria bacterium]|nr:hypothetical protein [Actinomycetota bacterium]NIU18305.1 hypothetical protein [Actinomycetota bacterium]NIU70786.1 hypothetical protein [Actinomycetota bacterium]
MKRFVGLVLAGVLAAYAAVLPEPAAPSGPDFVGPEAPASGASATGSVWYCGWLDSGDIRDSSFLLASIPPAEARITLPSAIPNQDPIEEAVTVSGPGSRIFNVADVVRAGAAPGFVELDDGPAAVAASVTSQESLAGDRCVRSVPKIWYLVGGTTRDGRDLEVRLFNPFPDLAKVTVSGVSEFGPEPLPELGAVIDVPGRAWVDLDLDEVVPLLDDLMLVVGTDEGLIIPTLSLAADGGDDATWPATGPSTYWEFPVVQTEDLVPELVVVNPGSTSVRVDVDVFEFFRDELLALTAEVPAGAPLRLALPENEGQPYGIRVVADGPIAAAVVAESPIDPTGADAAVPDPNATDDDVPVDLPVLRVAGTVGVEGPSTGWLLPGAGSVSGSVSTIWIMNTSEDAATVTLQPLGVRDLAAEKISVLAGRVVGYEIPDDAAIASYFLESTVPISAAWTTSDGRGTAFIAGVGIDA